MTHGNGCEKTSTHTDSDNSPYDLKPLCLILQGYARLRERSTRIYFLALRKEINGIGIT